MLLLAQDVDGGSIAIEYTVHALGFVSRVAAIGCSGSPFSFRWAGLSVPAPEVKTCDGGFVTELSENVCVIFVAGGHRDVHHEFESVARVSEFLNHERFVVWFYCREVFVDIFSGIFACTVKVSFDAVA